MFAIWFGFGNGILRYDTAVVFDIHIQVRTWSHATSELQDFREAIRSKPVIGVIANVRLRHDLFLSSDYSATIDEVPNHMPDFGDVGVYRDVMTVGQYKSRKPLGIRLERIL